MKHFIDSDIDEIIKNTYDILPFYKGKKILLTGGNGFLDDILLKFLEDTTKSSKTRLILLYLIKI